MGELHKGPINCNMSVLFNDLLLSAMLILFKTQCHISMKNVYSCVLLASVICFIVLHFRASATYHDHLERAIHQRLRRRHSQGAPGTIPGRIGAAAAPSFRNEFFVFSYIS